ncbi:class I SAM-dependent RNA methyltransferase [soil metagenome]
MQAARSASAAVADIAEQWQVGDTFEVTIGAVAHGGHFVARHEGRVLFVRHCLPGELVNAQITSIAKGGRFVQADAIAVLQAAPGRVEAPCPYAGPGLCGGCDFQHVHAQVQREFKAQIVSEQFQRLAGIDLAALLGGDVPCEPLPLPHGGAEGSVDDGHGDGGEGAEPLGWRTRVEFAVDAGGTPGLRQHRSRDIVPVSDCLIAAPGIQAAGVLAKDYPGLSAIDVVAAADGTVSVPVAKKGPTREVPTVTEIVELPGGPVRFAVGARGFWQVHPAAASTFAATVLDFLQPEVGERGLDLYAGVGLFAVALSAAVGPRGRVNAVEGDKDAVRHGRSNLAQWPQARMRQGQVDRVLRTLAEQHRRADVVVLDPPRVGAGRAVLRDVALLGPRAIAYVACDPAALARDTAYLADFGWKLRDLRIVDAFPMTHHVECLAHFAPVRDNDG